MDSEKRKFYLHDGYARAVYQSGGDPLLIPLLDDPDYIRRIGSHLHGVVLPGSDTDVDPKRYLQEPNPRIGLVNPLRDAVDSTLLEVAFSKRMPVLAICYGVQILNVQLGGTLLQDIPSQIGTDIRHERDTESEPRPTHPIIFSEQPSILWELASSARPIVNSSHHQALDEVSQQLEILAWAPDGIVEAVRLKDPQHFVLGVQWHPERDFEDNEFSEAIFRKFLDYVKITAPQSDEGS